VGPEGSARKITVAKMLMFRDHARKALAPLHDAAHKKVGGVGSRAVDVKDVWASQGQHASDLGVPALGARGHRGAGHDLYSVEGERMLAPPRPDHHALLQPGIAQRGDVAAYKASELGVALVGPHAHYVGDGHGSKFGGK